MKLDYREVLQKSDRRDIEKILCSSGYFQPAEIVIALELFDETLKRGTDSGYSFILAIMNGQVVGYSCFGPIPCTVNSWDLYWLAVADRVRGKGIGRNLVFMTEERILRQGGKRAYIETSSRELYLPTRRFYEKLDYTLEAVQKDYYDEGDHKCLYVKKL